MKKFFLFALVATMFAACVTDEAQDVAIDIAPETLTVSFEGGDSRIQLNEAGKTVWTKDDLVSVFYRSNANQQWQFQGETGDVEGTLKCNSRGNTPSIGFDKIVAVYPYDYDNLIEIQTGNIQTFLPATQNYVEGSFGVGSSIMISSSRTNTLHMKNVCGWLKVQLTGDTSVRCITLKGNNGEQVAGNVFVTADTAECTLATELNGADENNSGDLVGTLIDPSTILTEVSLICSGGIKLSAEPTAFYIALPPQTFEKGLTIEVISTDNLMMNKSTDKEVIIERNHILPMSMIEVAPSEPVTSRNNEIWYTATAKVAPYNADVFGANIVSNDWDETIGNGIITFDGPVTSIGSRAFDHCTSLTSITIPDSVTSIGYEAFWGCTSLTSVTIPDSVTSIGEWAFDGCTSLTSITIPDSVTSIGSSAFEGCSSLTSVTIGNRVTSIGSSAFDGCTGELIVNCNIPSASSYYSGVFYGSKFTKVTIGDSVTSIGDYAFYKCTSLTSITIPNSVTSIGGSVFRKCSSLTSMTIPDSVTEIENYAFEGCSSLTSVTIGNSVTSIGDSAFSNCGNLKSVDISDLSTWCKISFDDYDANPLYYGAKLYLNGSELTDITIPSDITEIKDYTFYNCTSLTSITIPDSVTSIGDYSFRGCTSLTSVTIPDSVIGIGGFAFRSCASLTSVTIPNSVTSIGTAAFQECKELKDITLPNTLSEISKQLFADCSSLTNITIPDSVTSIGYEAFYKCTSLTSVTIPDSVTSIGDFAFYKCTSLTSATIPDSVTSIGSYAFRDCTSLKDVYCKPTTPPTGGICMFSYYNSNSGFKPIGCKIYVPIGSGEEYKAKGGWSDYASYIEEKAF